MTDLDKLRPDVREAVDAFDIGARIGMTFGNKGWNIIRAELLRLQEEEIALSDLVQSQAKILTGVANALKGEPGRLHLHSHHDLAEVAQSIVAELAALKARIAGSARVEVTLGCAIDGEIPPDLALCKVALVKVEE